MNAARGAGLVHVAVVTEPIDVPAILRAVQHDGAGATSLFLGTVREVNDGRPVTGMEYEAYHEMAVLELRRIAEEACAQQERLAVALEHRVGALAIGEVSVAIACSHPHRAPAMDAARDIIEALKRRVPIWKREHYADGERVWIDPTRPSASLR